MLSITAPFVADIVEGTLTGRTCAAGPRGLPLFKLPYGRITALDMNRVEIVWQVANGDGLRGHPTIWHVNLGRLGNLGRPSPLATKTLLFVGEGSRYNPASSRIQENMPIEIATKPWFRAYDKVTGDVVLEMELPGVTTVAPVTYMHDGRQYIVVAVGGTDDPPRWIALSLP